MENSHPVPALPADKDHPNQLTWALCIATLNRIDALEECVRCALRQTRPPSEIVIVDASDGWANHHELISAIVGSQGVPLRYIRAEKRSLTRQRNQGVQASSAAILFMIDDDAFMHADCAEKVMDVYEADVGGQIAAIACSEALEMTNSADLDIDRKDNSAWRAPWVRRWLRNSRTMRFIWREVFLMSDQFFINYDGPREVFREALVRKLGLENCVAVKHISGFSLTVRRAVLLEEPFEGALLSYSPTEDTEASYRFTRHGANARVTNAFLYHHHAATGRIKRRQAMELTVTNLAFFLQKRSSNLRRDIVKYYVLGLRRLFAEVLKDGLSRRWSFPQVRGTFAGLWRSIPIFLADRSNLDQWYQGVQEEILKR